ncbi:hypothetical protein L1987_23963 [Smallanthus sonchifolius]|uniref:Uncharacterized protein n=1 Tax=Smallanthus sonchifolius TaxID=185202 RepID=A0ACB9IJQ3_9ASTR|nr:hypothetical protein L1987_23963 [Smallanthus sonchifolius]
MQDATTKMTRTYLLLQKKLHELESEFTHLSKHRPETSSPNPVADEFQHRLVFLRNLFTAEIALHPLKPNHLDQINGRLDELEAAFHHRYTHKNSFDGIHGDDDLMSSCIEPSLNYGGEMEGMGDEESVGVYEASEMFNEVVELPTEREKTFGYHRKENDNGGSLEAWRRRDIRVMAFWIMLGAILMVNFSKLFYIF